MGIFERNNQQRPPKALRPNTDAVAFNRHHDVTGWDQRSWIRAGQNSLSLKVAVRTPEPVQWIRTWGQMYYFRGAQSKIGPRDFVDCQAALVGGQTHLAHPLGIIRGPGVIGQDVSDAHETQNFDIGTAEMEQRTKLRVTFTGKVALDQCVEHWTSRCGKKQKSSERCSTIVRYCDVHCRPHE